MLCLKSQSPSLLPCTQVTESRFAAAWRCSHHDDGTCVIVYMYRYYNLQCMQPENAQDAVSWQPVASFIVRAACLPHGDVTSICQNMLYPIASDSCPGLGSTIAVLLQAQMPAIPWLKPKYKRTIYILTSIKSSRFSCLIFVRQRSAPHVTMVHMTQHWE